MSLPKAMQTVRPVFVAKVAVAVVIALAAMVASTGCSPRTAQVAPVEVDTGRNGDIALCAWFAANTVASGVGMLSTSSAAWSGFHSTNAKLSSALLVTSGLSLFLTKRRANTDLPWESKRPKQADLLERLRASDAKRTGWFLLLSVGALGLGTALGYEGRGNMRSGAEAGRDRAIGFQSGALAASALVMQYLQSRQSDGLSRSLSGMIEGHGRQPPHLSVP